MQYIGIDNSTHDHKIHILDSAGKMVWQGTVLNNNSGFRELVEKVNDRESLFGFEIPHGPLVDYLQNDNFHLYSLNPLKIKRFKESLRVSGDKSDLIDARAIAEYLRSYGNQLHPLLKNSDQVEEIKHLGIVHNRLTRENTRYLNKLHFAVREYFLLQEVLFSDFGGKIQLNLILSYPSLRELKAASDEELTEFMKRLRYRNSAGIRKAISKIRSCEQFVAPPRESAYRLEVQALCTILLDLDASLNRIEKRMTEILKDNKLGGVFQSLPGAGVVLSAKLLGFFGDCKYRFESANGIQCLFGTAPKNYQSGSYHKVIMRQACNKSARAVLYMFSFSSLRFCSWARSYYDAQRSKGKNHSVAVRALSNKWVNILFKMWKEESTYQENRTSLKIA
jgi:transposase